MKKIFLTFIIICSLLTVKAQLSGSKFKGIMNIPTPVAVMWSFTKDTAYLINLDEGNNLSKDQVVETMSYTLRNNQLELKKISGISECEFEVIGKYKIELKEGKMFVSIVEDACPDRSQAWTRDPFIRLN